MIKIYEGMYSHGENPDYILEGNRIYAFDDYRASRLPLYTISNGKIYEGVLTTGLPEYSIVGNKIYEGIPHGELPLYEIRGSMAFRIRNRASGECASYHWEEQ